MRCITATIMGHLALLLVLAEGFTTSTPGGRSSTSLNGIFDGVKKAFAELDAFMDDASAR